MKKIIVLLFAGLFGLHISAQVPDSVLIQGLQKEVKSLKKEARNLRYQVSTLKKIHKEDLEKIKTAQDENAAKVGDLKSELDATNETLTGHQQESEDRFASLEAWTKQIIMIVFIVFGVLFILLLILVLLNRSAVKKNFITLEAKVDNVKEEHALAHKELEKKYMEEIGELKKEVGKK